MEPRALPVQKSFVFLAHRIRSLTFRFLCDRTLFKAGELYICVMRLPERYATSNISSRNILFIIHRKMFASFIEITTGESNINQSNL